MHLRRKFIALKYWFRTQKQNIKNYFHFKIYMEKQKLQLIVGHWNTRQCLKPKEILFEHLYIWTCCERMIYSCLNHEIQYTENDIVANGVNHSYPCVSGDRNTLPHFFFVLIQCDPFIIDVMPISQTFNVKLIN